MTVIIFFTKQFRVDQKRIDIFYLLIFFGASSLPLLIWQGREVAYGQRLLIGILPLCILLTCKYLTDNPLIFVTKLLTFFSYIGYFLFYSSEKLTLKSGVTLWGTQVGFTAENYYIEVIKAFTNFETILSALLRNIYVVDLFKFFNLRSFLEESLQINGISIEKLTNFLTFTDVYYNLNIYYLVLVNIMIFSFSYILMRQIINLSR